MADITPDVHILESIRADRGSFQMLLAEGIDNAFDADATTIHAVLAGTTTLQDNGIGITRDRELDILKFGKHGGMPSTALGRFGIGIKYQAVSLADVLEITSVSRDGRVRLKVDWADLLRRGSWKINDPVWTAARGTDTGTTVIISRFRWGPPTATDVMRVRDRLAQIFYPALAFGRTVTLNGNALPVLSEPGMTDVIEDTIMLADGKGAHVRGGLLRELGPLYQVQVSYRHRVIMPNDPFGCGSYGGLRRMFARVDLTGDWKIKRFKDGLVDPDSPALADRVEEILRPILEQCHSHHKVAVVDDMTTMLNDLLPPELVAVRPKKKHGDDDSSPIQRRRGAQHRPSREADESPRGPARSPRHPQNKLMIDFDQPLVEECGYGIFKAGRPARIILARDNPEIATLLELRDKAVSSRTLYLIALMIYMHAQDFTPKEDQMALPLDGPFGLRVWKLTQKQKTEEETS